MIPIKPCSRCTEIRTTEDFYSLPSSTDGLDSWCKYCRRTYQKRYKENKRKYQLAYAKNHKSERRVWLDSNVERTREYSRRKYIKRRAAHSSAVRKRKLRLKLIPGSHTADEWLAVLDAYGFKCYGCGSPFQITKDHIQPISTGGSDCIENIAPLCRSCNSQKSIHGAEWYMRKWLANPPEWYKDELLKKQFEQPEVVA